MPRRPEPPPDAPNATADVDAGDVGAWLAEIGAAIGSGAPVDVPCGSCTACCTSAQFVLIEPDEADARAHVPRELTVAAPGLPAGFLVLGFDEHGRCPMLVAGACSIYEHRPRTCRTYDCRVFAATGIEPEPAKVEIRRRVGRWRFRTGSDDDRARLAAVRAAADAVRSPPDVGFPLPANPTQLAALAVEIHDVFLAGPPGDRRLADPPPRAEAIAAAIRRVAERHRTGR